MIYKLVAMTEGSSIYSYKFFYEAITVLGSIILVCSKTVFGFIPDLVSITLCQTS